MQAVKDTGEGVSRSTAVIENIRRAVILAFEFDGALSTFRWKVPALAVLFQLPLKLVTYDVYRFALSQCQGRKARAA